MRVSKFRDPNPLPGHEGWSGYRVYANSTDIGWLEGRSTYATLLWRGEMPLEMWQPENLVSLIRVAVPEKTMGLSDDEVAAIAKATLLVGPSESVSTDDDFVGDDLFWHEDLDLKSAVDVSIYKRLFDRTGFFRLDVEIDGVEGTITYTPSHESMVSKTTDGPWRKATIPAEIAVMHDPDVAWNAVVMDFLKKHHSKPIVSDIDHVRLALLITDTSRKIAAQDPEKTL